MLCNIQQHAVVGLTLAQMRVGELFQVEGVAGLERAVCAVATPFVGPNQDEVLRGIEEAAHAWMGRAAGDAHIAVVVVACAVRQGEDGYVPSGFECDLRRDTRVVVFEQASPVDVKVKMPQPTRAVIGPYPQCEKCGGTYFRLRDEVPALFEGKLCYCVGGPTTKYNSSGTADAPRVLSASPDASVLDVAADIMANGATANVLRSTHIKFTAPDPTDPVSSRALHVLLGLGVRMSDRQPRDAVRTA